LKYETLKKSKKLGARWKKSSLLLHYSCCLAPWKARYFTHYSCCWGPFERVVSLLTHYICYCGLLWKRSEPTYTLHLLLWSSLKAYDLHITVAIVVPLKAAYLHSAVALGRPVKQSTCTLQLSLGAPLKAE